VPSARRRYSGEGKSPNIYPTMARLAIYPLDFMHAQVLVLVPGLYPHTPHVPKRDVSRLCRLDQYMHVVTWLWGHFRSLMVYPFGKLYSAL